MLQGRRRDDRVSGPNGLTPPKLTGSLYDGFSKRKLTERVEETKRTSRLIPSLIGIAEHFDAGHDRNKRSSGGPVPARPRSIRVRCLRRSSYVGMAVRLFGSHDGGVRYTFAS